MFVGFSDIAGTEAVDFDLIIKESPFVDKGALITGNDLDYLNRVRPNGNGPDIGAFEYYTRVAILPAINLLLLDE